MSETTKTFKEQEKTLKNAINLLKKYHKCIIIRPTGFGKTWMLTELIKNYDKVLYLYPNAVIRDTVVDRYYDLESEDEEDILDPETIETYKELNFIENCTLMTYAKLIRLSDDEINAMDYDLIIFDEAHRLGGRMTKIATEKLFANAKLSTHFIGATATPTRMDNFDVSSHFFGDRTTYIYTLYDAIEDGMIQKPNYCYATYDFRKDLEEAFKENHEDIKDETITKIINAKAIEMSKLYNMPNIIKDVCEKYAKDTNYMKFIVFFANKAHMNDKIDDVVQWFKEAYPDHTVNTLRISSTNHEESTNTNLLELLTPQDKHIDLIACIDMLNTGYHVNNQTGIFMYRGTKSNTIFTQQLGRALSAGANNSAIVFDIVDNLHRKAVFELNVAKKTTKNTTSSSEKAVKDNYILGSDGVSIVVKEKNGKEIKTQYHLDENNQVVDRYGDKSTFAYDPVTKTVYNTAKTNTPEKNINNITAECLNATGHEATYRELIAKTMAEPLAHRVKYALMLHLRSCCLKLKIEYPLDIEELEEKGIDLEEFKTELLKALKKNKLDKIYPLNDANAFMKIGEDDVSGIPISPCCKVANITVEQFTDLIFNSRPDKN